jgi:hypothetical protein
MEKGRGEVNILEEIAMSSVSSLMKKGRGRGEHFGRNHNVVRSLPCGEGWGDR